MNDSYLSPYADKETKLIQYDNDLDLRKIHSHKPSIYKNLGEILDIESQAEIKGNYEKGKKYVRKTLSNITNKANLLTRISNLFDHNQNNLRHSYNPSNNNLNDFKQTKIIENKNTELKFIQSELIEMGFELELINKVLKYFEVNTIELAIEYLTKTYNKWNHPFISLDLNENQIDNYLEYSKQTNKIEHEYLNEDNKTVKCLVCNEIADMHLGYSKHKNSVAEFEKENFNRSEDLKIKESYNKQVFREKNSSDLTGFDKDDTQKESNT